MPFVLDLIMQGQKCSFTDFIKNIKQNKTKHVGMDLDVNEPIYLTLDMMIDITLYIRIAVKVALAFIQDHLCARKQKLLCKLIHKVFNRFGWNLECRWDFGLMVGWLVGYLVFMSQRLEPIMDCPVQWSDESHSYLYGVGPVFSGGKPTNVN